MDFGETSIPGPSNSSLNSGARGEEEEDIKDYMTSFEENQLLFLHVTVLQTQCSAMNAQEKYLDEMLKTENEALEHLQEDRKLIDEQLIEDLNDLREAGLWKIIAEDTVENIAYEAFKKEKQREYLDDVKDASHILLRVNDTFKKISYLDYNAKSEKVKRQIKHLSEELASKKQCIKEMQINLTEQSAKFEANMAKFHREIEKLDARNKELESRVPTVEVQTTNLLREVSELKSEQQNELAAMEPETLKLEVVDAVDEAKPDISKTSNKSLVDEEMTAEEARESVSDMEMRRKAIDDGLFKNPNDYPELLIICDRRKVSQMVLANKSRASPSAIKSNPIRRTLSGRITKGISHFQPRRIIAKIIKLPDKPEEKQSENLFLPNAPSANKSLAQHPQFVTSPFTNPQFKDPQFTKYVQPPVQNMDYDTDSDTDSDSSDDDDDDDDAKKVTTPVKKEFLNENKAKNIDMHMPLKPVSPIKNKGVVNIAKEEVMAEEALQISQVDTPPFDDEVLEINNSLELIDSSDEEDDYEPKLIVKEFGRIR